MGNPGVALIDLGLLILIGVFSVWSISSIEEEDEDDGHYVAEENTR